MSKDKKPKKEEKQPDIRVRSTRDFKLRDNPPNRRVQFINLKQVFGFVPEVIAVEKVVGSWRVIVRAILTQEEMDKEDKKIAEMKKEEEKIKKDLKKKEAKTKGKK